MKKLVLLLLFPVLLNAQWIKLNFPATGKTVQAITITADNKIFVGVYRDFYDIIENPPYISTDKGSSWNDVNIQDFNYPIKSFDSRGNDRIVFVDYGRAHYSKDGGINWKKYNLGIENSNPNSANDAVITSKNSILVGGANIGYQASAWIARSRDDGNSWENVPINFYSTISKLINSPDSAVYVIAHSYPRAGMGGNTDYIVRSTDNGNSWKNVFLLGNNITTIKFEFVESIGCNYDGTVFVSSDRALYRSTDKGDNWIKIDSSILRISFRNFVYNSRGSIYTYNDHGIFKSNDNGNNWIAIDSSIIPTAMAIDSNDYLYIGTSNSEMYRSSETTTAIKDSRGEVYPGYSLSQNYPNPFNPSTRIKYSIPVETLHPSRLGLAGADATSLHVTLKVCDMLGREIETLVDEYQSPGNYELEFNGRTLASGVYFYTLRAGSFTQTNKFVLMK